MLKRLAMLAAISAIMTVYVLGQPNRASGDEDKPPNTRVSVCGSTCERQGNTSWL
jgi:hypothetical protein